MNETKSPLMSMGIWGSTIAGIGGLDLVLKYVEVVQQGLPPLIQAGAVFLGAVMAFYGRIKATKEIK